MALCDTGAAISACSSSIIHQLVPSYKLSLVPTSKTFNVANNKSIKPLGPLNMSFIITKQFFSTQVYVFNELNHAFILGRPFLQDHEAIIDFKSNKIHLNNPIKVHANENLSIKPNSICLVTCSITRNNQNVHVSSGLVGRVCQLDDNVTIKEALCFVSHNSVPVMIENHSNNPIHIRWGQNIAHFNAIADEDVIESVQSDVANIADESSNANFDLSEIKDESIRQQFNDMLHQNKDAFIDKHKNLGFPRL